MRKENKIIKFMPINKENFEKVIQLEVHESQSKFVAPNVRSLADCYLYCDEEGVTPYAIQNGKKIVGFLLLDMDEERKELMIWRMMIDKHFQGKGYGRETIKAVIEIAKEEKDYDVIIADYVQGNEVMSNLLRTIGFEDHSYNQEFDEYVLHYKI